MDGLLSLLSLFILLTDQSQYNGQKWRRWERKRTVKI